MTFIEWCIINKKDDFLDQMDEADLLSRMGALGKDALGLLGGRKPTWYKKLMADTEAERQAKFAITRDRQEANPATQKKRARRAAHQAELRRRRKETIAPQRPSECPPCPKC